MKIKNMFEKPITRDVKGVIKVGQKDDENVYQELEEYVVTDEIDNYLNRFIDAYNVSRNGKTDNMGVWISGFFGSGKSHFLKILSYILGNREVENEEGEKRNTVSFFVDDVKTDDKELKEKIADLAKDSNNIDIILFNIDSKSSTDSNLNKEAIKDVFMKVFNDHLGYCGSIPFLAEFERTLDDKGQYEIFKTRFEEIYGEPWTEARYEYYFVQDSLVQAVVELGIMSEESARSWADNAEKSYSLSIDRFAQYVKEYCDKKGNNHHVLFLVDEIGQYIADDSKLMLNLQTVTEDLGIACGGKAWIIVTSQQDIDSITKTMGDNFSKIQGRFATRISLSSADVDEVIKKRILYKTDESRELLAKLYKNNAALIKSIVTFTDDTPNMPLYKDENDFVDVYPFIPYQFILAGNVLTSVRQFSASGKHLADRERSLLALFKEAAVTYAEENEGILVPFNAFYSALDDFIDHTHRIVITQASRNERLERFDVELLKILFMLKHVDNFKCNADNLTTLMISSINEDTFVLKKKIEKSLRTLSDEYLIQKNGNDYVFLTNEEQEAEIRIKKYNVDPKDIVDYIARVAFEEILVFPNNKFRYSSRYQFSFNTLIDDKAYRNNMSHKIGLRLLTAYSGKSEDASLIALSTREKNVVVRLSDEYKYLNEIDNMKKIEMFLNDPSAANLTDFDVISVSKRRERTQIAKRVSDYIRFALENAEIFVNGTKVSTKSKDIMSRITESFEKLINSEYHKLKDMQSQPTQEDILDILKNGKTQVSVASFTEGFKEKDHDALASVIEAIRFADATAATFSIKQALDKFADPPYGYNEDDIEYLIAVLYRKGQISLKINSAIQTPASTNPIDAFKYITKKEFREKVLLEIKTVAPPQHVKAVKDIIKEFFGKTVTSDDQDSLMRDFRNYGDIKKTSIEDLIRDEYNVNSVLPGKNTLQKAYRLIEDVLKYSDPISFYKRVNELYDDFIDISLDIADLISFLSGVQKDKYLHAVKTYNIYEASKNYISDEEIITCAEQIKSILDEEKPFSLILRLEECDVKLMNAISKLLENDTKRIEPEVYADWNMVKESIPAERPYSQKLLGKINNLYIELLNKLKNATDVASLNGITSESAAIQQNCLRMIQTEENEYQSLQANKSSDANNQNENGILAPKPVDIVKSKPLTFRTLTKCKTYSIKSEEDIEEVVNEIREALKAQLEDGTVIKLN